MSNEADEKKFIVNRDTFLDATNTINKFGNYVLMNRAALGHADLAILLTGRDMATWDRNYIEDIAGTTFTGFICKIPYNVAIVEDTGAVYKSSNQIPHEIGHSLGAPHDGPENSKYAYCPKNGHIMAAHLGAGSADSYSACSEAAIEDNFRDMKDSDYVDCIRVKNTRDLLVLENHVIPMDITPEAFCKGVKGRKHWWAEFKKCTIYCFTGGFWQGYPMSTYPAPHGFRCAKGMVCWYGKCVPCREIGNMEPWDGCENI